MKQILVSQRVDTIESYNERRDALDQKWADFLWEAGIIGLPVFNHALSLNEIIKSIQIDGILLTGGNTPVEYGGSAPERDNTDNFLISYAIKNNIPLLGVCRGMQSIVIYFGGSLHKVENHVAKRHDLDSSYNVNSYHEYAPDNSGSELDIIQKATDGVIEHIKHKNLPIAGIMWHPEREKPFNKRDIELFNAFFNRSI
ncbi:MAG: gamma-glutamyl-gamma-aminobutyrate hydrolase family protein [Treponema sp.]|jgi:putative glutamine amidotransferase|nr:gamma-glutamyl-gamma-aminobutyrate hydrolase family protein [Treponema sp.]